MLYGFKKDDLFSTYFEEWIKVYKEGAVRKVTLDKYYMSLSWIKKLTPDLRLSDITRISYQQLINEYARYHERQTTMDFHHQLKGAILDAVDEGLIERDPTRKAIIKGKVPAAKKIKYINQFQLHTMLLQLDLSSGVNWDWFILLVAKTGMRFSEALALTPEDFDFEHQCISVSKTWDYKGEGGFLPTKNKSSVRKIQIDWHTVTQFSTLIKDMPKDKLQKCDITSKDEVGDLVIAFNDLIERVEELEEKRRSFVSDASHELKTPLSIIKLLSDSLIQTPNPNPEFIREFLSDMGAEVERLTRIVQRLLDLTKMDQTNNLQIEMASISQICTDVYEKLTPLAQNKDISFVLSKPSDDVLIPIDCDSITEAIYNIADNSIKYTENGGSVKMEIMRDLGNIMIRISDTGIGIPKEDMQKVFDRFYRVDKARARDTGGTGLGLSIAMDAVKLHGGYIEVSSEEEKGSMFTIVLPYNSDEAPPVEGMKEINENLLTEE